jgi:peptidylamidoglycolate lyase
METTPALQRPRARPRPRLRTWLLALPVAAVLGAAVVWGVALRLSATPARGEPYHLVAGWPQLPAGLALGQVAGVGVDSAGQVYIFRRADRDWHGEPLSLDPIAAPAVLVFDGATGAQTAEWGASTFVMPHGLTVDARDHLWLTDVGLHQVFEYDTGGHLLLALGEAGVPGDDLAHFNQPTDVAVAPDGSFYVSDGYGNARVVHFAADGTPLGSWGTHGSGPGQFDTPHSVALDAHGHVYVADRGNARLQIFDGAGHYLDAWSGRDLGRPWAVRIGAGGAVYVVDGGDQPQYFPDRARLLKLDAKGQVLASFGAYGDGPGQFIWPHTLALGPAGVLYVGEVSTGMRVQKFAPGR